MAGNEDVIELTPEQLQQLQQRFNALKEHL